MSQRILGILLGIFVLFSSASAENQRDLLFFWKEGKVQLLGHHRPYSRIVFEEKEEKIGETKADESGSFEIILSLDPQDFHEITARAFDTFDREILDSKGNPDTLSTRVLPGASQTGTILDKNGVPIGGAHIELRDENGKLLSRVVSDDNGKYDIEGVPRGAKITVSGEAFAKQNIPVKNASEEIRVGTSEHNNAKPSSSKKPPEKSLPSQESTSVLLLWIFWGSIVLIAGGLGFFLWKKRQTENKGN